MNVVQFQHWLLDLRRIRADGDNHAEYVRSEQVLFRNADEFLINLVFYYKALIK